MKDSQTPLKKDRVTTDEHGPAKERGESDYYYDDSTGYEVYEDEADDESPTESNSTPDVLSN